MSETVLLAEPYGDVVRLTDVPAVGVRWHGFANSAQFRSLMDRALQLYVGEHQRGRGLGWLLDTRQMSALVPADQLWLETDWNPRAAAVGIHHIGIVLSENIFGRIAMQVYTANTASREDYAIECGVFGGLPQAKTWLRNQL